MKIFYYYHVPKCGGTYTRKLLMAYAKKTKGRFISFNRTGKDNVRLIKYDNEIRQKIGELHTIKEEFIFVHHHHGYPGISELYEELRAAKEHLGDQLFLFTIVREPISFVISRVNHLKNRMKQDIDIQKAIGEEKGHNMMYKYFLYNHHKGWDIEKMDLSRDHFKKNLALIDHVFLQENLHEMEDLLSAQCGKKIRMRKKNVGKKTEIPTESQIRQLISCNQLDFEFYEEAKKLVMNEKMFG